MNESSWERWWRWGHKAVEMGPRDAALFAGRCVLERGGRALLHGAARVPGGRRRVMPLLPEWKALAERNRRFVGCHRGERAFVIGNGPSLARQDLAPLAGRATFAMNGFFRHSLVGSRWQPRYYCVIDPLLFKLDGDDPDGFWSGLRRSVTDTTYFVPAWHVADAHSVGLPQDRVFGVHLAGQLGDGDALDLDLTRWMPNVLNVAQLAIMVAVEMGFAEIVLLGLDHDWLAHRGPQSHFYAGHAGIERGKGYSANLSDYPYAQLLREQLTLWEGYAALRGEAARRGVMIVNSTDGGFLDVFERRTLAEML